MSKLRTQMLEARENVNHSRTKASVEIGVGVSTLYELEYNDKEPQHPLILKAIKAYISKNLRKEITNDGE